MKLTLRLTLLAAALCISATAFGQKFGYINSNDLIAAMPERESVQSQLDQLANEYTDQIELINVEFNNKYQDYQKNYNTLSESIRQLKEKELYDLQTRLEEFQRQAQNDLQRTQYELMQPIIERAQNAIEKVGRTNGFTAIFDEASGAIAYFDTTTLPDVLPLVKTELGIQ